MGNIRVDRITLAAYPAKAGEIFWDDPWFVRISGKFNHAWLRKAYEAAAEEVPFTSHPNVKDVPIAIYPARANAAAQAYFVAHGLAAQTVAPTGTPSGSLMQQILAAKVTADDLFDPASAWVLVGNTDLIWFELKAEQLQGALDSVLARRKKNADAAPFRGLLKPIPADACAFCVGEERKKEEYFKIQAHVLRSAKKLECVVDAALTSESQAASVEGQIKELQGNLKENIPLMLLGAGLSRLIDQKKGKDAGTMPELDWQAVIASLERIKTETKGHKLRVRASVPEETWVGLFWLFRDSMDIESRLFKDIEKNRYLPSKSPEGSEPILRYGPSPPSPYSLPSKLPEGSEPATKREAPWPSDKP